MDCFSNTILGGGDTRAHGPCPLKWPKDIRGSSSPHRSSPTLQFHRNVKSLGGNSLLTDKRDSLPRAAVSGAGRAELPAFVPILKRQKTLEEATGVPRCEWLLPSCSDYSHYNLLKHLTQEVGAGLNCYEPILAEMSAGGAYFMRSKLGRLIAVWKPSDEEAFAPHNPRAFVADPATSDTALMRKGIPAGEAAIREAAAFVIDRGLARCPPTVMVKTMVPKQKGREKIGSLQQFQTHLGSSDDFGPSCFNPEDCHRIMILDIRMLNQDRHAGNILVCQNSVLGNLDSSIKPRNNNLTPPQTRSCVPSSAPAGLRRSYSVSGLEGYGGEARPSPCVQRSVHQGLRLVPIDHGYTLPHPLEVGEAELCWLLWPQAQAPLSTPLVDYIRHMDVEEDVARLKASLGGALPAHCLLTLRIGTALLQLGVARGLSLYGIGSLIVRDDPDEPSRLETAISAAYVALRAASPTSANNRAPVTNASQVLAERHHHLFMSLLLPYLEDMVSDELYCQRRELRAVRSVSA